jgi:hypothetical protein
MENIEDEDEGREIYSKSINQSINFVLRGWHFSIGDTNNLMALVE